MTVTITRQDVQRLVAADPATHPALVIRDGEVLVLAEQDVTAADLYVVSQTAFRQWLLPQENAADSDTQEAYAQVLTDGLPARAGRRILTVGEWARATGISADTIWHALNRSRAARPQPVAVIPGGSLYDVGLVQWMRTRRPGGVPPDIQTDQRVLALLRQGHRQREIAEELGLTVPMVEWRLKRLRRETGLTTAELAQQAGPPTEDHAQ